MERAALALCCAWLLLGLAAGEPSAEIHVKRRGGLSPHGVTRGALELAVHRLQTDVFEAVPRTFDPLYKTPCWHSGGGLSCLPYFYLSGAASSPARPPALSLVSPRPTAQYLGLLY